MYQVVIAILRSRIMRLATSQSRDFWIKKSL